MAKKALATSAASAPAMTVLAAMFMAVVMRSLATFMMMSHDVLLFYLDISNLYLKLVILQVDRFLFCLIH
ncbi:hypothetical protein CKO_04482 [Citrobacter koseri ATCC BAA-895]|uniref:Uncharacterized protein n=1 Tax=Citrobacter koseri (strain ATCC BAA-895 / CDC 4225-83 / SGSC4696) TaxID=290338 RepID=A8APX3_CITK8|nr:hypothetical protein CKO_04482 [Citrobacter koseri ATCC BAA-895]